MVELQCQECSYRFETDREIKVCPYCGAKGSVKPVPSATDILHDVSNEERKKSA